MGRIGVVLFLSVGILCVSSANGYGVPGKDLGSKISDKASSFVETQKQNDASLDIPENAYPVENPLVTFTCNEDGLYSYPGDCTLGVRCLNRLSTIFTCTDVLHFNNVTKQCDTFCSARCDPMLACICGWDSCNDSKEMLVTEEPETGEPNKNNLKAPFKCIINGGLYPDPTDCNRAYLCIDGIGRPVKCRPGLHINIKRRRCQRPCKAGCDPTISCSLKSSDAFDEDCAHMPERGVCSRSLTRYYYDVFSGQCSEFVYGGCGGNSNNFKTKEECENRCKNSLSDIEIINESLEEMSPIEDNDSEDQNEDKSGIAPKCIPGDLMPYRYDCNKYYQCSSGRIVTRTCPTGLHFNAKTWKCDSPCRAKCDPHISCGTETRETNPEMSPIEDYDSADQNEEKSGIAPKCVSGDLMPNRYDCNKYYQCSSGRIVTRTCPTGLHFNARTWKCDSPCIAKCDPNISCGTETREVSTEISPAEDHDTEDQNVEEVRIAHGCTPGDLKPSRDDCNKYFECNRDRFVYRTCPEGLHFSKKTKTCDTPCKAKCDPKISCKQEASQTETSVVGEFASSDSPKSSSKNFKLMLKFLCFEDGLFPNTKDCSKYINCSSGISYELSCPPGKHFNSKTKRCEMPCSAKCDQNLICNWRKFKNGFQEEMFKSAVDSLCSKDDAVYVNPSVCEIYFRCTNGDINAFQCPNGQHFNKETLRCEEPCDAHCDLSIAEKCGWESTTESKIENVVKESTEELCSKPGVYLERNPLNCWTYFRCEDGDAVDYLECPNGQHFNKETLQCEEPCDAHCDLTMAEECGWESEKGQSRKQLLKDFDCETDGYHVNPLDCGSFIQCFRGEAYVISCPADLHYSPTLEICMTPCEAKCAPNYEDYCRADESKKKRKLHRPQMHSNSVKEIFSSESSFICGSHATDNGLYANPDNCSSYIECVLGEKFVKYCPQGLHFSKKSLICDTPCEARCDSSIEAACERDNDYEIPRAPTKSSEETTFDYEMFLAADTPHLMYHFTCMKDGIYRNPENCSTFIQCSGGHSYLIMCPEGLHFSEKMKICHYPCEAHCDANLACTCGWDTCDESEHHSEEVDCEAEPEEGPCKAKLPRYAYDVESGRCRGFYYGGCEGNSNNFRTIEECENKCRKMLLGGYRCPSENGMFGHFPDCMSYYHCKRGIPTLKRCPKGTAFDHKRSKCVAENEATCIYECNDKDAVYSYEEDCTKYIDCVNGVAKLEKCPRGKAFDPYEKDCVDKKQVETCF